MDFDQVVVKPSPGLCRCCLSEGCYKDLGTEYPWMEDTEIYADMLLECFDISISQHNDGPNGPKRLICEVCITRLRDACNFKKQVLDSEKKFVDMIGRGDFRPKVTPILFEEQMKSEISMEAVDMDDVEYLDEDDHFDGDSFKEESTSARPDVLDTTVKSKRGRPKKTAIKPEKKAKVPKIEEKPRTSKVSKGKARRKAPTEALSALVLSPRTRNGLIRRNAATILKFSTVIPFKWRRDTYLCFFCHIEFRSIEDLKVHVNEDHKISEIESAVSVLKGDDKVKIDVSSIACKICRAKVTNIDELIRHLKSKHRKTLRPVSAGVIPYRLEEDRLHCAVCGDEFQYFIKLNEHMNEHYGNYACELCGKNFLSHERLRSHMASHGSGYKCNTCPEAFDSLTKKKAHEELVHNIDSGIKCLFCAERFKNYTFRKRHHSTVHNIQLPEINCPICGKAFEILSRMHAHIKEIHEGERNFSCSSCDKRFFSKAQLNRHLIMHYGEKRYQCDHCKKSYSRKHGLVIHMRTHDAEREYVCPVCAKVYVQICSVRRHLRHCHPDSVDLLI